MSWPRSRRHPARRTPCADGHVHDSGMEAKRCATLHLMQRCGLIDGLRYHTTWDLVVNGMSVGRYTADFDYHELERTGGVGIVVEDVKGEPPSRDYVLRIRLMRALHGIEVRTIDADGRPYEAPKRRRRAIRAGGGR